MTLKTSSSASESDPTFSSFTSTGTSRSYFALASAQNRSKSAGRADPVTGDVRRAVRVDERGPVEALDAFPRNLDGRQVLLEVVREEDVRPVFEMKLDVALEMDWPRLPFARRHDDRAASRRGNARDVGIEGAPRAGRGEVGEEEEGEESDGLAHGVE